MQRWKARYKDKNHDLDIEIKNQFDISIVDSLQIEIDGIKFNGIEFDDFELCNSDDYDTAKSKFNISKWGGNTKNRDSIEKSPYIYDLQSYCLTVEIPTIVIERNDLLEKQALIIFEFSLTQHDDRISKSYIYLDDKQIYLDKVNCHYFKLVICDEIFEAEKPSLDFETSLNQICKKIKDKYILKNCFGCRYSDYSVYGNGNFGTMLCFKKNAEKYLTVNNKDSYSRLLEMHGGEQQQETNLCSMFAERKDNTGYRG